MWEDIESALTAWVRAATELPEGQVIYANQHVPRPLGAFVTLHLSDLAPVAGADPVQYIYSAARVAGTEMEERVESLRWRPMTDQQLEWTEGVE